MSKQNSKKILIEVASIVAVYLLLSPLLALPLYEKLLFFPDNAGFEPTVSTIDRQLAQDGCVKEDVHFPSAQGDLLHGWFYLNPRGRYVVLVSHGNGGNISSRIYLAQSLVRCGCSVLLYDYQGYGTSGGVPSVTGICNDANAAYDFLAKNKAIRQSGIILYGESLGGGVSSALSLRRPARAIVLQSTFPSLLYACRDRLWFTWLYPSHWFPVLDNVHALSVGHAPALIVHGARDTIFPLAYARTIYKAARPVKQLLVLDNMQHVLTASDQAAFEAGMKTFLQSLDE